MERTCQSPENPPISNYWNIGLILLVVLFSTIAVVIKGFHMFSSSRNEPFIQGADDAYYFMWLRSWVIDGDINFSNDIVETPYLEDSAKEVILAQPLTETGLVMNKFTVGWAFVSIPFYLIADWVAPLTRWQKDGFSPPYQIAIWFEQILIACFGFYLMARILRRWFSTDVCIAAIALTWLNSPMIYYQSARISMVHNIVFVLGCLVLWLAIKVKEALESPVEPKVPYFKRYVLLLTLCAAFNSGLLVISRPSSLVYLVMPVALISSAMWRHFAKYRFLAGLMVPTALIGAFLGVIPQLLAWKFLYGHWIYYSYQGEGFNWLQPQLFASLISDHHGWFNWHPMLLVGLISLVIATLKGRFPVSWMATAILIIWTNASWHMVYFGSAFGGRAYEFMGCFATLGIAFLIHWLRSQPRLRTTLLTLLTISAIWNGLFLYTFMQGMVSRELPVSWKERFDAVMKIL